MGKVLAIVVVFVALAAATYFSCCGSEAEVPPPERDGWFGRGPRVPDADDSIRPFRVDVSEDVLVDLQRRLNHSRLGEDLENTQFQYGFQVKYMEEMLDHWKAEYNWRKHEAEINKYPQYKTTIEGINVHFIHVKPSAPQARKRVLLMMHGWPGSVWEFYKIIPMLTNPGQFGGQDEDAFEVVCPSIPGYGFSEAPHQAGFNLVASSRVFRKLMERLGHRRFYLQGGDWGGLTGTIMAQLYPQHVLGAHLNMFANRAQHVPSMIKTVLVNFFPSLYGMSTEEYERFFPYSKTLAKLLKVTGYMHIQGTKPDTIAFALNDSPVGLAAYILEKFSGWTDINNENLIDGGLTQKFTMDDLLTNVMIYWVTGTIGSSMRYYKENLFTEEVMSVDGLPVTVPTALTDLPNELFRIPRILVESRYTDIVQFTSLPRGGHFAAMEEPRLLADDIFKFIDTLQKR